MREFKNETIVITKEGWFFLKQENRKKAGCQLMTQEQLEKAFGRIQYRNDGAGKDHPIVDNEIRISKGSFNFRLEQMKQMLKDNGFDFREDGFVIEGINL